MPKNSKKIKWRVFQPKNKSMGVFKHQEITYEKRLEIVFYKINGKSYSYVELRIIMDIVL